MSEVTDNLKAGRAKSLLRVLVPAAVTLGVFAYLFSRIDARAVLDSVSLGIALAFLPPLVAFNLATLAIEARCLNRAATAAGAALDYGTAARIKAACYLLNVLNYALGAAGLSILLRRRTRLGLADAASVVFLLSLLDISAVLLLAVVGAAFLQTGGALGAFGLVDTVGLRIGMIAGLLGLIAAGFAFLKFPGSLGPLDRLRNLDVFRAPRNASIPLLLELGVLRIAFVACFVSLVAALLWAFDFEVPAIRLCLNVAIMLVVSALPVAAGGLGTGQWVFVELFQGVASDAELLAASLVFSFSLIASRALLGVLFAFEFMREALDASRAEVKDER